jgi:DNA repair protein RadC
MSRENKSIKSWAEDDRPREKLLLKGATSLSHAELLAILINSGNDQESALDLSKKILKHCTHKLAELSKMSIKDLQHFRGIGQAKAITIIAAMELAKRKEKEQIEPQTPIKSSLDAYHHIRYYFEDLAHEQFWIILLNRAHKILHLTPISKGGISATVVDPKLIFSVALEWKASSIILVHNHPSGNITPSENDKKLTDKIKQAARFLEITVLDHLIIGQNEYFSFADQQVL